VSSSARRVMTKKTILVVEDDPLVRQSLRHALEGKYEVLTAKDGVEGLRRFDRYQDQISLIVTDLRLPRLGGEHLLEWVRRVNTSLPVIVTTGWAEGVDLYELSGKPNVALLWKPFELEQLMELMASFAV
jgi:two-component system, cell cycle sensor histidine kinase and response regulator CckA